MNDDVKTTVIAHLQFLCFRIFKWYWVSPVALEIASNLAENDRDLLSVSVSQETENDLGRSSTAELRSVKSRCQLACIPTGD
jgi:hypothetical protein